jgi:hypothetical protein
MAQAHVLDWLVIAVVAPLFATLVYVVWKALR